LGVFQQRLRGIRDGILVMQSKRVHGWILS
jgi:hypothetical protein